MWCGSQEGRRPPGGISRLTSYFASGGDRIRTGDFYDANVALYRAELHPRKGRV